MDELNYLLVSFYPMFSTTRAYTCASWYCFICKETLFAPVVHYLKEDNLFYFHILSQLKHIVWGVFALQRLSNAYVYLVLWAFARLDCLWVSRFFPSLINVKGIFNWGNGRYCSLCCLWECELELISLDGGLNVNWQTSERKKEKWFNVMGLLTVIPMFKLVFMYRLLISVICYI